MATAEIISIGTELLLGDVLDTNSQYFASELARLGLNCYYRTTVGDNKDRIKSALALSLSRSDIVITSGGLGPTVDDLTTECIAEFFGVEMTTDERIVQRIEKFFTSRGIVMPVSNRKQAQKPVGADWLPNRSGTAPGIIWTVSEELLEKKAVSNPKQSRSILTFPGVPSELKLMWEQTAREFLQRFVDGTFWSCELKHFGIGESALAEKFGHLMDAGNPTVAPYAGRGECRLRVTARGATTSDAQALAQPLIDEIKAGSGILCYGIDTDSLESVVGKILSDRKLTIAVAESCTGGLVSKRLTDIAGSSQYIKLNATVYSNQAKTKLLHVSESLLTEKGAVSAECAQAMANGMLRLSDSDIALSVTGVAGPGGGTEEKPVGLVYFCLRTPSFSVTKESRYPSKMSRDDIRWRAANEALNMVRLFLLKPDLFENELGLSEIRVDYRMTINRGIVAQFKRCQLVCGEMSPAEGEELRRLVEESGVLSVQQAFVERAGSLVTWNLTVEDSAGAHKVSARTGHIEPGNSHLDVTDLLNFLNPFLEEWTP